MNRMLKLFSSLILVVWGLVICPANLSAGQSFMERFTSSLNEAMARKQGRSVQTTAPSTRTAANNTHSSKPQPTGKIKKTANLRSGPGTTNSIVGSVPKGTSATIVNKQGQWYQIKTEIKGNPAAGWMYAPLVEVQDPDSISALPTQVTQAKNGQPDVRPDGAVVDYAGYSKGFKPIKQMMKAGNLDGVQKHYAAIEEAVEEAIKNEKSKESEFVNKVGYLGWLERGTLLLDAGDYDSSVKDLAFAERILEERMAQSKLEDAGKGIIGFIAGLTLGNEEIGGYSGEGYERVLMLNYKSLAYLLQGKRQAYNVTRRAIDWQNMEKKAFEEMRREAEEKLAKKREEQKEKGTKDEVGDVETQINKKYAVLDKKALSVPSAYVNPFGYYVAGMIQEYESYDDRSLRDNAKISYKKALELNPKSDVLKKAVKDLSKRQAPGGTRVVHVIVADGFVPEKKTLTYGINVQQGEPIPLKLSIYEPDVSTVNRIEVQTTGGKRLATLSPVADIEAICLRHQKDMEPFRQLKVTLAVASSVVARGLASNNPIVSLFVKAREKSAAPDMRSWMSLPATINAARIHLKKGVKSLKIVTYDKKGKRLASKKVPINRNSHDFVYARSVDKQLFAHSPKELWMLAGR